MLERARARGREDHRRRPVAPVDAVGAGDGDPPEGSAPPSGGLPGAIEVGEGGIPHPSPHVARVLDGLWERLELETVREAVARTDVRAQEETRDGVEAELDGPCALHLLHPHLVTIACTSENGWRTGFTHHAHVHHFAIVGEDVRALDPYREFRSREAIDARLREACEAEVARETATDGVVLVEGTSCDRLVLRLGPGGVSGVFAPVTYDEGSSGFDGEEAREGTGQPVELDFELSYESLRDLLVEDGLLARLLSGAAPRAEPAAEPFDGVAVSRTDLDFLLWSRGQTLSPAHQARLGLEDLGHRLARLVYLGTDTADAAAIAELFGAPPLPVRLASPPTPLALPLLAVREDAIVRTRPEAGPVVFVLPAGTLVAPRGPADRARFVDVHTPLGSGSVARSLLVPHRGCVPRAPGDAPGSAARLTARVRVAEAGATRDAALFARSTERGVEVRLHALDPASCAVGDALVAIDAEGAFFDLRLTPTRARGGDTLVLVGTGLGDVPVAPGYASQGEFDVRYTVRAVGAPGPEWTRIGRYANHYAAGARLAETADGTYFPISFDTWEALLRFTWTGTTLAEQPAPAPDP